jgi:hypothetical protein
VILERLMPTFNLALRHRVIGRAAHMMHVVVAQPLRIRRWIFRLAIGASV